MRAVGVALAAGVAVSAAVAGLVWAPSGGAAGARPNIIVISTDDQALSWFSKETMPHTWRHLVRRGTRFQNAIVTTPLCCPARASFLTGQYGHNNGVQRNHYGDLREPANVLPAWLQNAGYTTAHVGKWLNNYNRTVDDPALPAPGFDLWRTALGNPVYYEGRISIDGRIRHYGSEPRDLLTKQIGRLSVNALNRLGREPAPFYLQIDHYGPHGDNHHHEVSRCEPKSPEPAAAKFARFRGADPPRRQGFNERDMSDKPPWAQGLKPVTVATRQWLRARYRCALAATRTVDSQIGKLFEAIEKKGLARNTVIIFWSDNGYLAGEHRMVGKARPYEQALRVPFVIRAPAKYVGKRRPARVREPVANIDLAPTILRFAEAEPCLSPDRCRLLDGRPLNRLLQGKKPNWPQPRRLVVEKNRGVGGVPPPPTDPDLIDLIDGVADEYTEDPDPGDERRKNGSACTFAGLWTPVFTYSVYTQVWDRELGCLDTRQVEIYNTREDPYQLEALPPELELQPRAALRGEAPAAALFRLATCAGTAASLPNPCD